MRTTGRAILLAVAATIAAHAEAEDYVIRLSRPTKVGNRYRIDARGKLQEHQRVTANRQVVQNEENSFEVRLVGLATVAAVDGKSFPTRIAYSIDSCKKTSSGETREVVARGSKVVAESKEGKTAFLIDGEPASADVAEALNVVVSAREPDSASDDEIFGTRERRGVGDKWGINTAAAVRDLSRKGLTLSASDLIGGASLEGVRTVDGVKALEISAHMRADRMSMQTPAGIRLEKANMDADFRGLFPADPQSRALLTDKMHILMSFRMGGQKPATGEKFVVENDTDITVENNYSSAPEEPEPQPASPRSQEDL